MRLIMQRLEKWQDGCFSLKALHLFWAGGHAMLLCPELGSTLFLDGALAEQVVNRQLDEDLMFLLVQRGMAAYDDSRPPLSLVHPQYPHFFLLDLTNGCNLRCRYCFRDLSDRPRVMSDTVLDAICDELIAYGRRHSDIRLSIQPWGGEPLTRLPQIARIRARFDQAGMEPEMVIETNGTLLDFKTASLLRELRINIGVSLDGIPSIQDLQRPGLGGEATSPRIQAGIHNLYEAGYTGFGAITVVTRNTLGQLRNILEYYANVLHLKSVKFNPLRQTEGAEDLLLSREQWPLFAEELLTELIRLRRQGVFLIEQNISQRLRNLLYRPCDNICSSGGCQGGYAMLSINQDGDVFPCEMSDFPELSIGHIGEQAIEEMVSHAPETGNPYYRPRRIEQCGSCSWRFFCGGGCKAAGLFATGDMACVDAVECMLNQAIYPRLVKLLMEERETALLLMGEGG